MSEQQPAVGAVEVESLTQRVAELEGELAIHRACTNGKAVCALATLMEQTGSFNQENPWLGITAAVALMQLDAEKNSQQLAAAEAQRARLERGVRSIQPAICTRLCEPMRGDPELGRLHSFYCIELCAALAPPSAAPSGTDCLAVRVDTGEG